MTETMPEWGSHPLDSVISGMWRFNPSKDYYALTLGANRRGNPYWSRFTHWVGYSERQPQWEMRAASLVKPELMRKAWEDIGQSWHAVHDDLQLALYIHMGGHMLAEKEFAEDRLADKLRPMECAPDGVSRHGGGGFIATEDLDDESAERYAPSRKLRGQVLKRDDYRCAICGRRPRDHIDLELHVHHVIPWRMGGPTAEANLITLCGTCHKGLDPDYQPRIRELAGLPGRADPIDKSGAEGRTEIQRYREITDRLFALENDD